MIKKKLKKKKKKKKFFGFGTSEELQALASNPTSITDRSSGVLLFSRYDRARDRDWARVAIPAGRIGGTRAVCKRSRKSALGARAVCAIDHGDARLAVRATVAVLATERHAVNGAAILVGEEQFESDRSAEVEDAVALVGKARAGGCFVRLQDGLVQVALCSDRDAVIFIVLDE